MVPSAVISFDSTVPGVDARRIRLGDGVAEDSFKEGVFHLGDVGAQFGCDLDLAVGGSLSVRASE